MISRILFVKGKPPEIIEETLPALNPSEFPVGTLVYYPHSTGWIEIIKAGVYFGDEDAPVNTWKRKYQDVPEEYKLQAMLLIG